jgi:hypothetical protein|nr:MAG TPA: hypothetical protein [Caudoviricetes sp.]
MISEERKEDTLTITLTNGDIDLFNQAIEKYNFIDGQAMLRFALSLLIIAEDKEIKINKGGMLVDIAPNKDLIKKSGNKEDDQ